MRAKTRLNLSLEGSLNVAMQRSRIRLLFLVSAIAITFLTIAGKTVKLTFFYEPEVIKTITSTAETTTTQTKRTNERFRKAIYDRNGILISSNLVTSSLFANPKIMIDPDQAAKQLNKLLPELPLAELKKKFNDKKKSFVWVKRNLHPKQKYEINALGIPGLQFEDEEKRIYPHKNLFAHSIGMVGQDGHGLSGLERFLDNIPKDNFDKVFDENNINTTLDVRIQSILKDELQKQKDKHKAQYAAGVVMDVTNGEIVALSSLPDYDPNLPKTIDNKTLFNILTLGLYEMGSVFKPFTFAIGFDQKKIHEKMVIDATEPLKIGRFTINDFHAKKRPLSVPEVLMYSSNIGTAKIAQDIGKEKMQEYFKKLGFYNRMEVEIIEKSTPTTPKRWGELTNITASYGHGLAVSPMHVIAAMAAVVNGGLYYQPTLIKRTKEQAMTQPRRVFSQKTSEEMRRLLRLVVTGGSGGKANTDGYIVGGKTGTAEKIEPNGRYSHDKVVSTFVGVFPMNNPKYAVLAIFDDPKASADSYGYATAGWVAAPAVGNVIKRMAPIMRVKPIDPESPEIKSQFDIEYKKD